MSLQSLGTVCFVDIFPIPEELVSAEGHSLSHEERPMLASHFPSAGTSTPSRSGFPTLFESAPSGLPQMPAHIAPSSHAAYTTQGGLAFPSSEASLPPLLPGDGRYQTSPFRPNLISSIDRSPPGQSGLCPLQESSVASFARVPGAGVLSNNGGPPWVDPRDPDIVAWFGSFPIRESSCLTTMLSGETFTQSSVLEYKGKNTMMFVFSDLAVKAEGTFVPRYRTLNVYSHCTMMSNDPVLAECFGGPFRVYSTKEFPGLRASTDLTKHLAVYGVRVHLRENERKRRRRSGADAGAGAPRSDQSQADSAGSPTVGTSSAAAAGAGSASPTAGGFGCSPERAQDVGPPAARPGWDGTHSRSRTHHGALAAGRGHHARQARAAFVGGERSPPGDGWSSEFDE
ncbi:velvet factor-domain-containing protein [Trametes elegans]|nr:velvet factor-domain-containing protein [Trametes elegans]